MTELEKKKVDELTKRAREGGLKSKRYKTSTRSSLHQIIKTKDQARRFLRLMQTAKEK